MQAANAAPALRRLKLRELLLPKVVDRHKLRETRARAPSGNGVGNVWAVPADLFPSQLPQATQRLVDEVGGPGSLSCASLACLPSPMPARHAELKGSC